MAVKKSYKFAALKAEAKKANPTKPPFVLDDVVPKITIKAPRSFDQVLEFSALLGPNGGIPERNVKPALEIMCGDQFARVWDLIKDEDVSVGMGLFGALLEHYNTEYDAEAADVPGGSDAS